MDIYPGSSFLFLRIIMLVCWPHVCLLKTIILPSQSPKTSEITTAHKKLLCTCIC